MKTASPEKPLYKKLKHSIIEQIQNRQLKPGDKLPSLNVLASEYNVSLAPVLQAIQELDSEGYIVRYQGKGVFVNDRIHQNQPANGIQIALVVPGIDNNEFFSKLARHVAFHCKQRGAFGLTLSTEDYENEAELLEELPKSNIAGAIICPPATPKTECALKELLKCNFPFVVLNHNLPSMNVYRVTTNDFLLSFTATKRLLDLGHTNIALMLHKLSTNILSNPYYQGYIEAFTQVGLTPNPDMVIESKQVIHNVEELIKYGQMQAQVLMSSATPPSAFMSDPAMATGMCKEILSRGLRIPEDVSVVILGTWLSYLAGFGIDDFSCIDLSLEQVTNVAVDVLLQQIQSKLHSPIHIQVPGKFIPGKTIAPFRGAY